MPSTRVGTPGGGRWIVAAGGMGNYGNPEGDPEHVCHVEHWRGSRSVCAETHLSLRAALVESWVPDAIKDAIRRLYIDHVREILRRDNVTEPGGEWSVFDVARELDPKTHKPTHLFDTGPDTQPRAEYVEIARAAVKRIEPSGRYVGGVSKYLYSLPREQPPPPQRACGNPSGSRGWLPHHNTPSED